MGVGGSSPLGPPRLSPHGRGGLLCFGTTEARHRMGVGASSVLGPPRPPPHGRGNPSILGPPRPPRMGVTAYSVLGPPRPRLHGRGGLLRFGTTEGPATWAWKPPPFWDHRGPNRMGEGASFVLGPPGPLPYVCGGPLCFGTTEVCAACPYVYYLAPLHDCAPPPCLCCTLECTARCQFMCMEFLTPFLWLPSVYEAAQLHACGLSHTYLWHPSVYYLSPILVYGLSSPSLWHPSCTTRRRFMSLDQPLCPFNTPMYTTWRHFISS